MAKVTLALSIFDGNSEVSFLQIRKWLTIVQQLDLSHK